jgi:hypothetical protein
VTVSLTPQIYIEHLEVGSIVKSWGWKIHSPKLSYKKNDLVIKLDNSDSSKKENLWLMEFFQETNHLSWKLPPQQIKQVLDHLLCFGKKNKKDNLNSSNKLLKNYVEKSLVKMGKVYFPMSFWLEFSKSKTVQELLEKLFDLPVFLSNAYLLLCVLKKGESVATIYDYSRGRKT